MLSFLVLATIFVSTISAKPIYPPQSLTSTPLPLLLQSKRGFSEIFGSDDFEGNKVQHATPAPTSTSKPLSLESQIESQIHESLHGTSTKGAHAKSTDSTMSKFTAAPTHSYSVIGTPGGSVPTITATTGSPVQSLSFSSALPSTSASSDAASSASSNSNTKPWKIAGIALICISLVIIISLSITFFDSWTRFLKDVVLGRRSGQRRLRDEPELVVDWEKRSWEYKLASEDDGHRYPSMPDLSKILKERETREGGAGGENGLSPSAGLAYTGAPAVPAPTYLNAPPYQQEEVMSRVSLSS